MRKDFVANWLAGIGRLGRLLLGVVLLGAVGIAGYQFVHLAGQRPLSQLEVTLFQVILFVTQMVAGVYWGWLGTQSSTRREYESYVGSPLRRTYSLADGLRRAQDGVREGISRMSERRGLDAAAQRELWREIMNAIYCHLTELLSQAEDSKADWKQIGGDQAAQLEALDKQKEREVAAIDEGLQKLYGVMAEMPPGPVAQQTLERLETYADSLERALQEVRRTSVLGSAARSAEAGEARRLLTAGAFEEAVDAYTAMIELKPSMHTLYIGRAGAKYLAGDEEGAMEDLSTAAKLQPGDPTIARVRDQMEHGQWRPVAPAGTLAPFQVKVVAATEAVRRGDADHARQLYLDAGQAGLIPAFLEFDLALVEVLAGDPDMARGHLGAIDLAFAGPFMRVQVEAAQALCDALAGTADLTPLQDALAECQQFDLRRSPGLLALRTGLSRRGVLGPAAKAVFDRLEGVVERRPPQPETNVDPGEGGGP
jgi:tetratricopeptide (TPR) repeat protein